MSIRKLLRSALIPIAFAAASSALASPARLCAAPAGGHGCFGSIQAAIDAALPGATIDVYPGAYLEIATDRAVVSLPGARHQFGLFIGTDNLTIRGVDAGGQPIGAWSKVSASITTDATNSFGPSAIFVQGDGVTLSGLGIGANASGLNKTIEVIGDNFALLHSDISDLQGSIYINDFRFDAAGQTSHVQSYRIEGNNFRDGVSVDIASGAGVSGALGGRTIVNNVFVNSKAFPSISFNGAGTGIKWFAHPVGGAVIEGNMFINTFSSDDAALLMRAGHIQARGLYDKTQFDWATFLGANTFNQAYATGPRPPELLREFAYSLTDASACAGTGTCTFQAGRIGASLDGESAIALAGDATIGRSGSTALRRFDN